MSTVLIVVIVIVVALLIFTSMAWLLRAKARRELKRERLAGRVSALRDEAEDRAAKASGEIEEEP
ncbi:MAG: hypothetical protein JJE35_11350 [Thermoleophilia bacterium]|nr:hypothetical protein [Thermoleophilia bacterium]